MNFKQRKELAERNSAPQERNPQRVYVKQKKSCCSSCLVKILITLLVLVVLAFGGFNIFQRIAIKTNTSSPNLFERKATIKDISVSETYSFPANVKLVITPFADIEDLEIQLNYLDASGNVLQTQFEKIGNVERGKQYSVTIWITNMSASTALKLHSCVYTVSRGLIDLFG